MASSNNWTSRALADVFDFNPSRDLARGTVAPFLAMADVIENERLPNLGEARPYTGGARFGQGDVLFARITPSLENGKTAFVKSLPAPHIGHGSTEFIVWSGRPGVSSGLFAYYLSRHPELREYAAHQMSGSSGRQRVSWEALAAYRRPLPELPEQEAIAAVLGGIDDKIESNRYRATLAEELAATVFQGLFAQNASPVGAPRRTTRPLADLVEVNPRTPVERGKVAPFVEMADVRPWASRPFRTQTRAVGSGCRFAPGDTLFARIAGCVEYGKGAFVDFVDEPGTGSTEFIVLRAKPLVTPEVVFLLSRSDQVRRQVMAQMSGSSGRQRVPPAAFGPIELLVPETRDSWREEAKAIEACFAESRALWKEALELAAFRDAVLPELLNGKLRVAVDGRVDGLVQTPASELAAST